MNNGVIVWLVIFAVAAAAFLVIAAVVSIRGFADLRTLLRHTRRHDAPDADLPEEHEDF